MKRFVSAEEAALVKRVLAGDEASFDEFFDGYSQRVFRFALVRLDGNRELAAEMMQATLARAFEKLGTFRGEAGLFSWLCSICRFEISAHFRRLGRMPPLVPLPEDEPAARHVLESLPALLEDPEEALLRAEVSRLVHVVIDHLPPRYGEALEWKYGEGLSVREIAERLEISPKAAESILSRARKAFREGFTAVFRGLPEPFSPRSEGGR